MNHHRVANGTGQMQYRTQITKSTIIWQSQIQHHNGVFVGIWNITKISLMFHSPCMPLSMKPVNVGCKFVVISSYVVNRL